MEYNQRDNTYHTVKEYIYFFLYLLHFKANFNIFQKNFEILSCNYKRDNVMKIKINYNIWIYKLKLQVTRH
jgi:hypothetical protein